MGWKRENEKKLGYVDLPDVKDLLPPSIDNEIKCIPNEFEVNTSKEIEGRIIDIDFETDKYIFKLSTKSNILLQSLPDHNYTIKKQFSDLPYKRMKNAINKLDFIDDKLLQVLTHKIGDINIHNFITI